MNYPGQGSRDEYVRVVVVSPVRIYRQGLVSLFGAQDGVEVTGAVGDLSAAPVLVDRYGADVVLLDVTSAPVDKQVLDALGGLAEVSTLPVVALGVPEQPASVVACVEAGVAGYVTNDDTFSDLVDTLRAATRGEFVCKAQVTAGIALRLAALARERRRSPVSQLTSRELEIVTLIDSGFSNKEIASRLDIQLATVKNHVHNILDKLGVRGRGAAAAVVRGYQAVT